MLRIPIASLKPGIHYVELEPEAEELDLDPARFRDVRVKARLDRYGERILATLEARALAMLECDRTLVLFEQEIAGSYNLLFVPPGSSEGQGVAQEEVQVLLPSAQEIDVTDAVRDTLLLAIPARCIAPGAEEAEIQTQFGDAMHDDPEIDPRWEALRKLRPNGGGA